MLTVGIICVGKLKEKYWQEAYSEYIKRLGKFCKFSVKEVSEHKVAENPSDSEILSALNYEGKSILNAMSKFDKSVCLCIESKIFSSEDLSKLIEKEAIYGTSSICFVIGGSWGLSSEVKNRCSLSMSMSRMTFPHQLARVMLCEQIYRAFNISANGKYHK